MIEAAKRIRRMARTLVESPGRLTEYYRSSFNAYQFQAIFAKYKQIPPNQLPPDGMIERLVEYWANSWSAKEEYIVGLLMHLNQTSGPILECGSGITTLLLGHRCQQLGRKLWVLEHHPGWATRMRTALAKHKLDQSVHIIDAPLVNSEHYSWYDVGNLPEGDIYNMVVCDGPPGHTHGGRYGLMPVLGERLSVGCHILLDDASRLGEQEVLARWEDEYGIKHEMIGQLKPYAVAIKSN
ncbi:MAG: class I SAM-dependent methyltransferase [Bacteroidales bacterium]|nr:class I SAM-dependent methyltransferase [Bacteroidales bacterium]